MATAKDYSQGKKRGNKGRYISIPHSVMDHLDYISLKGSAVKLLNALVKQYRGNNNGNLCVAYTTLKKQGFNSKDTITKAKNELVEKGLIVQTRLGRFTNPGSRCDLYAITWLSIDECLGCDLEINPTKKPYRAFSLPDPRPENGLGSVQKQVRQRLRDDKGRFVSS